MNKIAEIYAKADSFASYAQMYGARLSEVLESLDGKALTRAMETFEAARANRKAIYILGNGGSAALASHLVNDLVAGAYLEGRPAFRAFALSDNISTITALANDCGYENIFLHHLKVHLEPGDVVLAMSVSGNSPNILRALTYARSHGAATIGMCGFTGGKMAGLCDILIHAETTADEYGPVEDVFGILGHMLSGYLAMKQGKALNH
ncbi:MAG TPA: SIS domain-containing protein [Candidatus Hydrogenedentes bacterium]|nr:SIS domain-containing protein [Candidatus Hydrogenedentota bacterium]